MRKNRSVLIFGIFFLIFGMFFLNLKNSLAVSVETPAVEASAASSARLFQYTLLESVPGFFTGGTVMTDLPAMILAIYKFGIWTIGISGLFMITIGGIMYAGSAGNTAAADSAKRIITDALIGIAAAVLAYLFLYLINPDLTRISINFTAVNVDEYTETGGNVEADKMNNTTAGGCIKPVNAARGNTSWVYNQKLRGQTINGTRYTDCSDFVASSYKEAGCSSPGSTTLDMYKSAKTWTNNNELKAGDAIVNRVNGKGHIVLCLDDGCNQIIHSPGTGKPVTVKSGDYFTNKNGKWSSSKVIKASNYCGSC
ncbi:MAG: C40 family peptidase [Candidatus Moranbacteria bacterium]|nr:C40 family peptidase [Candidatus Moranbacteria bacterium]